MKRFVLILGLTLALVLLLPSAASAWRVRNNSGTVVGTVTAHDIGHDTTVGYIRSSSSDDVIANVRRVVQDEFNGWLLCNGTTDQDWMGGILRRSSTRFTLGRVDGSHPVARAIKTSNGRYWVLRRKVNGNWTRIGSVRGGCKGAWAVGAAPTLLWQ